MEAEVDGGCFVNSGNGPAEDTDASGFCVISDADAASVIATRYYLTCAACAVVVECSNWTGKIDVVVEVMRVLCVLRPYS